MPWRGVWGRNGARRGRRARVPPPARAASRREQLSQPCRGSSRQFRGPSNRSHSSAACATRRRRRPAAAMIGLSEKLESTPAAGEALRAAGFEYMRKKSEKQEER